MLALTPLAHGQTGLIGHWKLDENGQKNLVTDSSPNPIKQQMIGDQQASRGLSRPYREPWNL